MTSRVVRIIGKVENTERFLRVALYQVPVLLPSSAAAAVPTGSYVMPLSVCSSHSLAVLPHVESVTQRRTLSLGQLMLVYT